MHIVRTAVIFASLLAVASCAYPPRTGYDHVTPYTDDQNADERTAGIGVH